MDTECSLSYASDRLFKLVWRARGINSLRNDSLGISGPIKKNRIPKFPRRFKQFKNFVHPNVLSKIVEFPMAMPFTPTNQNYFGFFKFIQFFPIFFDFFYKNMNIFISWKNTTLICLICVLINCVSFLLS